MFILNFRTFPARHNPVHISNFNRPIVFNQNNFYVQQNFVQPYNPYVAYTPYAAYNNPYAYNQASFGGYGYSPYGYGVQSYQPPVTAFNYLLNDGRNFVRLPGGGIPVVDPWMNGPQTVNLLRGLGLV